MHTQHGTHTHNIHTNTLTHKHTPSHKHTCCYIPIIYTSKHTHQKQEKRESTHNRTHTLTHQHIQHCTHMHNIHTDTKTPIQTRMHAPPHKHTCCCIQMSYESARTHTKTYTHTRPQAWSAPADSGQRHQAYIHAIMSNQSSSHTRL